jgi:iron complex outermembrane receptor protein
MAPLTFWNINNGERDRAAVFGELESKWTQEWKTLMGVRYEHVRADVGDVQGYNTLTTGPNYNGSTIGTRDAFNNMNRKRADNNIDVSAMANFTPDQEKTFEFGYSRKVRSPNLYERYSWSSNTMAAEMNNFVGDGNGYVGNPDLKPEVAHKVSATADWHAANKSWEFRATPYFTYVDNYIDATQVSLSAGTPSQALVTSRFVGMKYQNQSARIWGLDLSGAIELAQNSFGDWGLRGGASYLDAKNLDTGYGLYNRMPPNGKLTFTQTLSNWESAFEVVGVQSKDDVSTPRNENKTPGYGLLNFKTSYTWKNIRFDAGVDNILDKLYYLPLGGAYTGQGATMSLNKEAGTIAYGTPGATPGFGGLNLGSYGLNGTSSMWGTQVPGMGRSAFVGVNISF